jgi:phosphoglycerate dehydrogenase-like enzyme
MPLQIGDNHMVATLFLTHRGLFQQKSVLSAAPANLDIILLRDANKEEVIRLLPEAEFLITEREDVIDADMIAVGRKLRLIQRLGSQTWDIDLAAAQAAGIPVCYWPDLSTIHVAEHCLMMTLDLVKKMREMNRIMHQAQWDQPSQLCDEDTFAYNWTGRTGMGTLWEKTAGILGFGEIGRELAVMLKGLNCRVLYNKRRPMPSQAENELAITFVTPDELAQRSDFVYCLLPFIKDAAQSMNARFFAKMRPGSYFVFCGGSGMVNEVDLIAALRSGYLAGAALDTYTYEPLPKDSPLLAVQREEESVNLVLTPHVAAGTLSGGRRSDFPNLVHLLAGEPLQYRVV